MRSLTRTIAILAIAAGTAGCASAAATPTPVPTQAPPPAPSPVPTPVPITDGAGPEYVTGTFSFSLRDNGTQTVVGAVTQIRNMVVEGEGTANDPRATGTSTGHLSSDAYSEVGSEWGTMRIENSGGVWEGSVSGAAWANGNASSVSGWLVGSGGYAGYTYYIRMTNSGLSGTVEGIIFPGTPPSA